MCVIFDVFYFFEFKIEENVSENVVKEVGNDYEWILLVEIEGFFCKCVLFEFIKVMVLKMDIVNVLVVFVLVKILKFMLEEVVDLELLWIV